MKHQFKYKDENNDTDIMFETCDKTQFRVKCLNFKTCKPACKRQSR